MSDFISFVQNFPSTIFLVFVLFVIIVLFGKKSTRNKIISLIEGVFNIGHRKAIQNPAMAESIFDQKISEYKTLLVKTDETVALVGAQLARAKSQREEAMAIKQKADQSIKNLLNQGKKEEANRVYEDVSIQKLRFEQAEKDILTLTSQFNYANQKKAVLEKKIKEFEVKKSLTLNDLKNAQVFQEINSTLQDLDNQAVDQELDIIIESAQNAKNLAIGSEMAYQESTAVKLQEAYSIANTVDAEDYFKELMEKENK